MISSSNAESRFMCWSKTSLTSRKNSSPSLRKAVIVLAKTSRITCLWFHSLRGGVGSPARCRFVWPVGRDHDASRGRFGVDEPESGKCTAVGEEATPRSQHQRADEQHLGVDEVAPHQRLAQLSAAPHHQAVPPPLLYPH